MNPSVDATRALLAPYLLARVDPGAVAARSYWHHNGFAKLVLDPGPGRKLRLHVWPAGDDRRGDCNPHAHMWDLASTVLCGVGLANDVYVEDERGVDYDRFAYANRALTPAGAARLVLARTDVARPGDLYELDAATLHASRPLGSELVATLVVQGPRRASSNPVLSLPGRDPDGRQRPLAAGEVAELVRAVAGALPPPARALRGEPT